MKKGRTRRGRWGLVALSMAVGLASYGASAQGAQGGSLLEVLLKNGTITPAQYAQLKHQAAASPAGSQDALLSVLKQNGAISATQYAQLSAQASTAPAPAAAPSPVAAAAVLPKLQSSPGFTMKIGGRVQADAAFFDNDKTHNGNEQEMRRARLDLKGKIGHDWGYSLSYDFASTAIKNANFSYLGFKDTDLTFGYFKEPFSLEYQTSSKYTEFQERSMLDDSFDPPKRIGIGAFRHVAHGTREYTAYAGVFGEAVPSDVDKHGDSGIGVAGRATYAFVHTDDRLLHVGASAEWRNPGDGEVVDIGSHPGAHLATQLIDTGPIQAVDSQLKTGVEAAGMWGPLALQGQYTREQIRRNLGQPGLTFGGWYVQGSYFLTNDSRAAAYDGGAFGGIKPNGRYGAWQLALRYDHLNLLDKDVRGGEESNAAVALNWYINRYLRWSVDYIKVLKLDRPGTGFDGDKPGIVEARFWLGW